MSAKAPNSPNQTVATLSELLDRISAGVELAGGTLYAHGIRKGRFEAERNMTLHFQAGRDDCRLMHATLFPGRGDTFLPWAELYNIQSPLVMGDQSFAFFDSELESSLIQLLLGAIPAGGRIFVAYEGDPETAKALEHNTPAAASRLGYILFQHGATWFKDWYFPEGFMEGGRKLQGEKAITPEKKTRHLERISREIYDFLRSRPLPDTDLLRSPDPMDRATARAKTIVDGLPNPGNDPDLPHT
ncbi:MAG: DUF1122 family protein [Desulfobacterales bacterium]